jgi:drug/metabolite transporter (DMT)-like permease
MAPVRISGAMLCLASAAAFGAMAAFGTLAYDNGATVGTLLAVRFSLAAVLLWALLLVRGGLLDVRSARRRDVALALALGACGYAAQAGCYFSALQRIDASLLTLLLYTFPAIVAVAAIALGRDEIDARRVTALLLTCGGLALVVGAAGAGGFDTLGAALALAAAVLYSAYILVSEGVARRMAPRVLSALVCSGAAVSLLAGSALLGQLRPGALTPAGWGWLACLSVISTVAAISLFFAGLRRVGPTTAAILSTVEPLVTVLLAVLLFGEALGALQVLGGLVMLAGLLVLNARARRVSALQARGGVDDPLRIVHDDDRADAIGIRAGGEQVVLIADRRLQRRDRRVAGAEDPLRRGRLRGLADPDVEVGVGIGPEALHAHEQPPARQLVERCLAAPLELDRLKDAARDLPRLPVAHRGGGRLAQRRAQLLLDLDAKPSRCVDVDGVRARADPDRAVAARAAAAGGAVGAGRARRDADVDPAVVVAAPAHAPLQRVLGDRHALGRGVGAAQPGDLLPARRGLVGGRDDRPLRDLAEAIVLGVVVAAAHRREQRAREHDGPGDAPRRHDSAPSRSARLTASRPISRPMRRP